MTDNIKPEHYRKGEIDLYEAFSQIFPHNEYRAGMQMIAIRYMFRDKIDRVEDISKAIYSLERLKEKEIERAEKVEDKGKSQLELFHEYRREHLERLWSDGYRYIARDSDEAIFAFETEPIKLVEIWETDSNFRSIDEEHDFFPVIQWEDKEPAEISELLEIYENGGENGKKEE